MWKLHRYYLKELLINAGITFVVLFAIVVISLVARGIQRAQGGGLLEAAMITLFFALDAIPHLLPVAFLMATVLTFARAADDREITAIRSAGISPRVPMMAAILVGLMLSIVGSLSMHYFVPEAHYRKYRVVAEVVRNVVVNMNLGATDDRISIPGTDLAMTFGYREDQGGGVEDVVLRDCWLYLPDDRNEFGQFTSPIFHVDKVSIPLPDEASAALEVVLEQGSDPLSPNRFDGIRLQYPLREISESSRRDERDTDIPSDQLLSEVLRGLHEDPERAKYFLNRRTCFSLLPLLLGPIGFCIALAVRNRGRAMAMICALVPLLVFYVSDVVGMKLLRATGSSVYGWLPTAALILLGVPFCWRELRK
ncbi:MAG: LptF/LptG family permease [Planctomycetota bacterium]|nr:LptF/LptG family permease [Planctomycetota bacterium]